MQNLSQEQQEKLVFYESINEKVKAVQKKCDMCIARLRHLGKSIEVEEMIADYENIKIMMCAIHDKVKASLVDIAHVYNEEGE